MPAYTLNGFAVDHTTNPRSLTPFALSLDLPGPTAGFSYHYTTPMVAGVTLRYGVAITGTDLTGALAGALPWAVAPSAAVPQVMHMEWPGPGGVTLGADFLLVTLLFADETGLASAASVIILWVPLGGDPVPPITDIGDYYAWASTYTLSDFVTSGPYLPDQPISLAEIDALVAQFTGSALVDRLAGTAGNDSMLGLGGGDVILGFTGDDTIDGGNGNDILDGGGGDDSILGGFGDDRINAGAGNDWVNGGGNADRILGAAGDDTLLGGAGNDTLFGRIGNDMLTGETGDDLIWAEAGDDLAQGGEGRDTIFGGSGADWIDGGNGTNMVQGEAGNDTLLGGADSDTLLGGDDLDVLNGGAGNDQLLGGNGADLLEGGAGNDELRGGTGFDTLGGNGGNDTLWGASGLDTFVFTEGADVVADFEAGLDMIFLGPIAEGIESHADLLANHMAQDGADVVITDAAGNTLRLLQTTLAELGADRFVDFMI